MYSLVKSWDNREEVRRRRLTTVNGRTWTRRARWLEDTDGRPVKLKLEDGSEYVEVDLLPGLAQTVWDRFKTGIDLHSAVSILGVATGSPSLKQARLNSGQ